MLSVSGFYFSPHLLLTLPGTLTEGVHTYGEGAGPKASDKTWFEGSPSERVRAKTRVCRSPVIVFCNRALSVLDAEALAWLGP